MEYLYLGLFAGAVFVLIGLSGSLLAFGSTLDAWLNPELITVPLTHENTLKPLDDIVAAGLKALPPDGKALNLDFSRHPGLAFQLWFEKPSLNPADPERHQLLINPYTGTVTGKRLLIGFERPWRDPLMDFILRFHFAVSDPVRRVPYFSGVWPWLGQCFFAGSGTLAGVPKHSAQR